MDACHRMLRMLTNVFLHQFLDTQFCSKWWWMCNHSECKLDFVVFPCAIYASCRRRCKWV